MALLWSSYQTVTRIRSLSRGAIHTWSQCRVEAGRRVFVHAQDSHTVADRNSLLQQDEVHIEAVRNEIALLIEARIELSHTSLAHTEEVGSLDCRIVIVSACEAFFAWASSRTAGT